MEMEMLQDDLGLPPSYPRSWSLATWRAVGLEERTMENESGPSVQEIMEALGLSSRPGLSLLIEKLCSKIPLCRNFLR